MHWKLQRTLPLGMNFIDWHVLSGPCCIPKWLERRVTTLFPGLRGKLATRLASEIMSYLCQVPSPPEGQGSAASEEIPGPYQAWKCIWPLANVSYSFCFQSMYNFCRHNLLISLSGQTKMESCFICFGWDSHPCSWRGSVTVWFMKYVHKWHKFADALRQHRPVLG